MKILSWNLYNLFDETQSYSSYGSQVVQSSAEIQSRIDYFVQTIANIVPDVVVFQEVGSERALVSILNGVYGEEKFQYSLGKKDKRGICTAIATNIQHAVLGAHNPDSITLPVWRTSEEEVPHVDMQGHLRGNPWVLITYMGKKLKIYGVHGKSKFGERLRDVHGALIENETTPKEDVDGYVRSLLIRAAEMRGLAQELLSSDELQVVIGDFNDSPEGAGTEILLATHKFEEMTRREGVNPYSFILRDGTPVLPDICLIDKRLAQYVVQFDVFERFAIPEHSREWEGHKGSDHAPILLTLTG